MIRARSSSRRARRYAIRRRDQIEALASPVRQEIVDALQASGRSSIAELAEHLGRAPDSLYDHVRHLEQVGLVVRRGTRSGGRREEPLYDVPGARMQLDTEPRTERDVDGILALVGAALRIAQRDLAQAFQSGIAAYRSVGGRRRNAWAGRIKGWLTRGELAEVMDHVEAIQEIVQRGDRARGGALHAVTWVITPTVTTERAVRKTKEGRMRSIARTALVPTLVFCSSLTAPASLNAGAQEAGEVLSRVREAMGRESIENQAGAAVIRGRSDQHGVDSVWTLAFDREGRFHEHFEGPLEQAYGFDGRTAWEVDWNGTARVLELGDRDEGLLSIALLHGGWTAPYTGLELTAAAAGTRLEFETAGHASGWIDLDPDTWLPVRAEWESAGSSNALDYLEWTDRDGVMLPARVLRESNGVDFAYHLESLELGAEQDWPRIESAPTNARFDPRASPELEVVRAPTGHLLVHPTVEGQDLGWFIFDTGAGANVLSTHVTERLEAPPFGKMTAKGVGGRVDVQFHRARDMRIGPLTLSEPVFVGMDLEFLSGYMGRDIGGIIGYGLLARAVVEYDVASATIRLHDPLGYTLKDAEWEPLGLYRRHPHVQGKIEGQEATFKIDTGAGGDTVTVHAPAVERLGLLEGRETSTSQAGGVGGSVRVEVGKLGSFELGGRRFDAIDASFATEHKGAFEDPYVDGNVGGLLLEPFTLVFDYTNGRVAFAERERVQ